MEKRNEFYAITESRLKDYRGMQAAVGIRCRERSDILQSLKSAASPSVARYDVVGGRSSNALTGPEAYVERTALLEKDLRAINRDIEALEEKIHALTWALSTLRNEDREIIEAFYFDRKNWFEIEESACLTESACRKRRCKAVWTICNILFTHRLDENRNYIFVS